MPRELSTETRRGQSAATSERGADTEADNARSRDAMAQYLSGLEGGSPQSPTVSVPKGEHYVVTSDDVGGADADAAWDAIARNNGMMGSTLKAFNADPDTKAAVALAAGMSIYLPSADEIVFEQLYARHGDYKKAAQAYGEMKSGTNLDTLRAARDRASGKKGKSYGVKGIGGSDEKIGYFLSPNPKLAGASSRRTETVGGQLNYRVVWVNDWKCSTFMNDVAYQAGYKPAEFSTPGGTKYRTAGTAHRSTNYAEVKLSEARPGDMFQKFGGAGSNESHNAVLSTFVRREPDPDRPDLEVLTFNIIGAEQERAAESERPWTVRKGTNHTVGGEILRFLRPTAKR